MKEFTCLSVDQPFATLIVIGLKTIEARKWRTSYRGPLMICSTANDYYVNEQDTWLPGGHAMGLVDLVDVRPLQKDDLEAAAMDEEEYEPGLWAWVLTNPRPIKPIPCRGQQRLYKRTFDETQFEYWNAKDFIIAG